MPLRSRLQASPCSDSCAALSILYSAAASTAALWPLYCSSCCRARPVQGRKPASLRQRSGSPTHARPRPPLPGAEAEPSTPLYALDDS